MELKDVAKAKGRVSQIQAILDWELIRSYSESQTMSERQLQELKQERSSLMTACLLAGYPEQWQCR